MDHRALVVLLSLLSSGFWAGDTNSAAVILSDGITYKEGESPCTGMLNIHFNDKRIPADELEKVNDTCRQLDCGSVVSWHTQDWASSPFILDFTCSESVRLVNGTNRCSGRVEVKSDESWSSVCEGEFNQQVAEVVCREFDCGVPEVVHGALYGDVEAPVRSREFQCKGNESHLLECHRSTCSSGRAFGLTCSDHDDVKLVGGASHCSGELELKHNGVWSAVHSSDSVWNLKSANIICHQLKCGSSVSTQNTQVASLCPKWAVNSSCFQSTYKLMECLKTDFEWSHYRLEITCSESVRLVNGNNRCSGRVEMKSDESWSSVCEGEFDQQVAKVVCRELDCGGPSVVQGALYGDVEAPVKSREFQCEGNEFHLLECHRSTCSSGRGLGLTCSDHDDVRLVGGASHCSGGLELKHNGVWRAVDSNFWNLKSANIICRQLDCGSSVLTQRTKVTLKGPMWEINPFCFKAKYNLIDCLTATSYEWRNDRWNITCSESVRLVNGTRRCSGRVEVKTDESWSSVCEGEFDQQVAEVVCRELDCGVPSVLQGVLYGKVEAPVLSREFQCEGNESFLLDCKWSDSATSTCSPDKAVGLTCSDSHRVRLVGEASRCAGKLEMNHQREWRPVADSNGWNKMSADTVCTQINCGYAVSRKVAHSVYRPVWWIDYTCDQLESALQECVTTGLSTTKVNEVICSDLLVQPNVSVSPIAGVSMAKKQGFHVLLGSSFTITCSTEPQYQGGYFHLLVTTSDTAQNYTLPAVNHSAQFLFPAARSAHRGFYTCVYHAYVSSYNFSSKSRPLHLIVSVSVTDLIIRCVVALLVLTVSTPILYFHFKAEGRRRREQNLQLRERHETLQRRRRPPDVDHQVST